MALLAQSALRPGPPPTTPATRGGVDPNEFLPEWGRATANGRTVPREQLEPQRSPHPEPQEPTRR